MLHLLFHHLLRDGIQPNSQPLGQEVVPLHAEGEGRGRGGGGGRESRASLGHIYAITMDVELVRMPPHLIDPVQRVPELPIPQHHSIEVGQLGPHLHRAR